MCPAWHIVIGAGPARRARVAPRPRGTDSLAGLSDWVPIAMRRHCCLRSSSQRRPRQRTGGSRLPLLFVSAGPALLVEGRVPEEVLHAAPRQHLRMHRPQLQREQQGGRM